MIRLRVKEVAQEKGMSQSKLSRRSDVDLTTLRRIYQMPEKANITLETLNRLAYALNCQPGDLMEYTRDERMPGEEEQE
jgi:DNA-binding Xre family transcriptional regulator